MSLAAISKKTRTSSRCVLRARRQDPPRSTSWTGTVRKIGPWFGKKTRADRSIGRHGDDDKFPSDLFRRSLPESSLIFSRLPVRCPSFIRPRGVARIYALFLSDSPTSEICRKKVNRIKKLPAPPDGRSRGSLMTYCRAAHRMPRTFVFRKRVPSGEHLREVRTETRALNEEFRCRNENLVHRSKI